MVERAAARRRARGPRPAAEPGARPRRGAARHGERSTASWRRKPHQLVARRRCRHARRSGRALRVARRAEADRRARCRQAPTSPARSASTSARRPAASPRCCSSAAPRKVYAVDVGHDQLHPRLRADPRVVSLEGVNARDLTRRAHPRADRAAGLRRELRVGAPRFSTRRWRLCAADAEAVILIKPQFEVGRAHVGKGGIVTDSAAIADAWRR